MAHADAALKLCRNEPFPQYVQTTNRALRLEYACPFFYDNRLAPTFVTLHLERLAPWRSRRANWSFDNGGDGVGSLESFSRRSFISLVKILLLHQHI